MNIAAAVRAETKLALPGQPRERSLHHPAEYSQPAAVRSVPARDPRADAAPTRSPPVRLRVVRPVRVQDLRRRRGRPRLPRTGGIASTNGSDCVTSWAFAEVTVAANGVPRPSTITWCLLPFLRRSTGLGPVFSPPPTALSERLSTAARYQSMRSARWRSERSRVCNFRHAPA